MWTNQKGFLLITFRLNSFRLWLPISSNVLFELIYGFYDIYSFFVAISGHSKRIRFPDKENKTSMSLKDIDLMINSIIYFLESARRYESFDLVDMDIYDKESRHIIIKISFV